MFGRGFDFLRYVEVYILARVVISRVDLYHVLSFRLLGNGAFKSGLLRASSNVRSDLASVDLSNRFSVRAFVPTNKFYPYFQTCITMYFFKRPEAVYIKFCYGGRRKVDRKGTSAGWVY